MRKRRVEKLKPFKHQAPGADSLAAAPLKGLSNQQTRASERVPAKGFPERNAVSRCSNALRVPAVHGSKS